MDKESISTFGKFRKISKILLMVLVSWPGFYFGIQMFLTLIRSNLRTIPYWENKRYFLPVVIFIFIFWLCRILYKKWFRKGWLGDHNISIISKISAKMLLLQLVLSFGFSWLLLLVGSFLNYIFYRVIL